MTRPNRKRFRPSTEELSILKQDHALGESDYKGLAVQRASAFNVTVKQIINWHKKYKGE